MKNETPLFLNLTLADVPVSSNFLVFEREKLLLKKIGGGLEFLELSDVYSLAGDAAFAAVHFIGDDNGRRYYCFQAPDSLEIEKTEFEFYNLRGLMNRLEPSGFKFASVASQILYWDRTTRFCGECGAKTNRSESERAKICPECGRSFYPAITPAIIVAVMNGGRMLLAHNKNFAEGVYSLIAGFVEPGESLEECVRREVMEETGIAVSNVKYFKSQSWPFPSSLMIGFTAVYEGGEIKPDGEEITSAAWFGRDDLPVLPGNGSLSRKMIDALMADISL